MTRSMRCAPPLRAGDTAKSAKVPDVVASVGILGGWGGVGRFGVGPIGKSSPHPGRQPAGIETGAG